jgi:superfamily II helicase
MSSIYNTEKLTKINKDCKEIIKIYKNLNKDLVEIKKELVNCCDDSKIEQLNKSQMLIIDAIRTIRDFK